MDLNEDIVFGALLEGGNRLRKLRRFVKQWVELTPPKEVEKMKPLEVQHAIENDVAPGNDLPA